MAIVGPNRRTDKYGYNVPVSYNKCMHLIGWTSDYKGGKKKPISYSALNDGNENPAHFSKGVIN